MAWNEKYWDILDQLYWTPAYLGLKSIPRKQWSRRDGLICVPRAAVNRSGPLYARERRAPALRAYLQTQEEILNQVFNVTFAIAPDELIETAFLHPMGFHDSGPFESIGREAGQRFGWGNGNVTQPDGLFSSSKTALAIELKLDAASSPAQLAKYIALLTWEELHSGPRSQLGLLFILPELRLGSYWRECSLEEPRVTGSFLEVVQGLKLPKAVSSLFAEHPDAARSMVDRMVIHAISWSQLHTSLGRVRESLEVERAGDQTLDRLLAGFLAQLEAHDKTGIGS